MELTEKNIIEMFVKKHGLPDCFDSLNNYVKFILNYKFNGDAYTEIHHILDKASFPEFKNTQWNLIRLEYYDHIYVHEMLFNAYNIRRYQNTLRFKSIKKSKELLSNASKKGWQKLKNNSDNYKKWKESRIKYLKSLPSSNYTNIANIFWKNATKDDIEKWKIKCKEGVTPEIKRKMIESRKIYWQNPKNREKASEIAKNVWESKPESERIKFRDKMYKVNNDPNKLRDAGKKISDYFKTEKGKNALNNRATKPGSLYEITFTDGSIIKERNFSNIIKKYNLSRRLLYKFMDTGLPIVSKHNTEIINNTKGIKIKKL